MKLKKFLAAAFAGVVLAAACTEEDPLALKANIEIDEEQLSFNEEADEKDITLTSTRNWKLNAYEEGVDWISVTPESGDASVKPQTVTISVKKNDSYNRETYLEFTNGTMSVPVLVKQKGPLGQLIKYVFTTQEAFNAFTVETKDEGAPSWVWDSHKYAKASGYDGGNKATETLLISPEIDLSDYTAAYLKFRHAAYSSKVSSDCSVLVREAGQTQWTTLSVPTWPSSYSFVNSGDIDLSAYVNKKIQIAFRYTSTTSNANTWEIDEIEISREPTPLKEPASIAEIKALSDGDRLKASGLTVQIAYKDGLLVSDGKEYMLIYSGYDSNPAQKPGDVISLEATVTFFTSGGGSLKYPQLTNPDKIEVTATGQTVTMPEPVDITSTFQTFDIDPKSDYLKYYKLSGTISVSGNYVNFKVAGEGSRTGSIISAVKDTDLTQLNEVSCTITGFFVYSTGKTNQYINFLVTDVNLEKGYVTVSPNTLNTSSEGGPLSFDVNTNDAWTIAPVEGLTISPLSGTGKGSVAVTVPANSAFESKTFSIVVSTAEKTAAVTVKQSAAADPSATVYELTNAEIVAAVSSGNSYTDVTINSASGTWTGNMYASSSAKFIQIRNSKGSFLKTPVFEKEISKIEFMMTADKNSTVERTLMALPADFEVPSGDTKYGSISGNPFDAASLGEVTAPAPATTTPVVLNVAAGHKQIIICTVGGTNGGGSTYIDSLKVYFK